MNKVYEISNFNVNVANPKYNPFGNTYEMILKIDTNIKQVDSESDIPEESQLFISFTEFHNKNQDEFVDVLGIITRVDDVSSVFIKQKEVMKRDIVIKNVENEIINVVFWRKKAEEFSGKVNDVICIKGGKVNVFRGNKTLSVQMSSAIKINDDSIDEVKSLMESVAEE